MNNNDDHPIETTVEHTLHCSFCHHDVEENEWNWEFSICDACSIKHGVCGCDYCNDIIQMIVEDIQLFPEGECYPQPLGEQQQEDEHVLLCPECVPLYLNNYPE